MPDYSLSELAALTGLSSRTIRFYMTQGLIPSPGREGRATRYPETTLARLRLVCSLRDAHQPLAVVRRQLEALGDDEVVSLTAAPPGLPPAPGSALDFVRSLLGESQRAAEPAPRIPFPAPPSSHRLQSLIDGPENLPENLPANMPATRPSPKPTGVGDRSQWERIVVGPDIELHVRRPLSKPANRTVERLVAFARQLQEEQR